MECQSGVRLGAAPAGISAATYLLVSLSRLVKVSRDGTPREVSPLSRQGNVVRGRTHPLSDRLQTGIRFLPHPFPAVSSASFAVSLLAGRQRGYFVHLFDRSGGEVVPFGRWCIIRDRGVCSPCTDHVPFGSSLTASWLVFVYGLYQHFTWVDLPRTAAPDRVMLAVAVSARAFTTDPRIEVTLSPGFGPHRCQ